MRSIGLAVVLVLAACSDEPAPAASGTAGDESPEGTAADDLFRFIDVASEAGLAGFQQVSGSLEKPFLIEAIGGGLALLDFDQDGDMDVYFTNGSSFDGFEQGQEPSDALYENDGRGNFRDVTAASGLGDREWGQGVRVVDYNADGFPDLYVTNFGPNVLYRNLGDGTFEDVTDQVGLGDEGWSTGASFFDFDRDGDLDLYLSNYIVFDKEEAAAKGKSERYQGIQVSYGPRGLQAATDRFFRNEGDGKFSDVSSEVGIDGLERYSFQAAIFDLDGDGWLDVYVAVDSQANIMWRNLEGNGFEDVALRTGTALGMNGETQGAMGIAIGDYDGDLAVDMYVTNFSEDYFTLYRSEPGGVFRDVTNRLNLRVSTLPLVGWGCGFEDFDSDGDFDLFAINGHVYPQVDQVDLGTSYRQTPLLFENLGEGRFADPSGRGGPGFAMKIAGRGSAVGDLDGDGDLDLLIENLDSPPTLLRNDSAQGNWIKVLLIGAGKNREAIGARLVARCGDRQAMRLVGCAAGFLSSNDPREHFGLGSRTSLDVLEVSWPNGEVERFEELVAGKLVTIEEGRGVLSVESLP